MTAITIRHVLFMFNLFFIVSASKPSADVCSDICFAAQSHLKNMSSTFEHSIEHLLKQNPSKVDLALVKGDYSNSVADTVKQIDAATDPSSEFCTEFIQLCSEGDSTALSTRDRPQSATGSLVAVTTSLARTIGYAETVAVGNLGLYQAHRMQTCSAIHKIAQLSTMHVSFINFFLTITTNSYV